jgi:aquaporin Z
MSKEFGAEFMGTFALVSAVCGAALFSAPSAGLIAVALAVGLSVLAMAYAVGHISGGHFNPAVTIGLVVGEVVIRNFLAVATQCESLPTLNVG